jgi:hypothetical protein
MGNNPSSQVDEAGGGDSRSASPLPGEGGDDGYDGLPRLDSSAATDFHVDYSQAVDGLPTFSQPTEPARKAKKTRKSNLRRSPDTNSLDQDHAEANNNDAVTDDLEAVARNLKSEPESPEIVKSKKKKRKKPKGQNPEQNEDQQVSASGSLEVSEDLPAMPEVPDISPAPEEATAMPATELNEDAPAPSFESSNSRKKKKKSKTDKAKGPHLDLNEDPIAGSDDEVVIPSSGRPSRSRRSLLDDAGSSRKFRKKASISAVSRRITLGIEDVANEDSRADVIESTQGAAASEASISDRRVAVPVAMDFLRRSREPEQYEMGEDNISPSVTRQERRSRLASSRSASASLADIPSGDQALSDALSESQIKNGEPEPLPLAADGDAMDIDTFDPRLNGSADRAASQGARGSASDYSGNLPDDQDQDQAMEDDAQLPRLSHSDHATPPAPETVDFMSTLEDDAIVALASTQPQPATDDNQSRSNRSSAEHNEQQGGVFPDTVSGDGNDARSHSTASSEQVNGSNQQRNAQTRAASRESRMDLQFMLDGSRDAAEATASEAMSVSEVERQVPYGRGPGSARPSINNVLVDESSAVNPNNQEAEATMSHAGMSQAKGNLAVASDERPPTAHLPATQTPHVERSSAHSTPRSSRTYARQPKPTFFERSSQDTALAFAELPSNEVAATPKPARAKAKRRLPVDVPDAESGPSKRQRSSLLGPTKATKGRKAPKDPDAPKNPPGRKKAPETAIRNSAGFLTGVLTKTEIAQVEGAVEAFRVYHEMERHEVNTMIHQNPRDPDLKDNKLHEDLWSRIGEACPTRPRQKLLNWCRQKFHNFVARGTWTPEQDEELRQMVKQHGTKWSVVGQLINRHQKDVRDRWRNYLVAGNNQRKNYWSEQEENEFLEIVAEVLGIFQRERETNPNSDMFKTGKSNEELVDWNVVAERMHHARSRLQCQEKWRRMREANKINTTVLAGQLEPDQRWRLKRARHEIASMSHADMYHIVLAIRSIDSGAKDDIRINWKAVLESQRKKYHLYTGMLLWNRLRQLVPDQEEKNVQECANELITMYQSDGGTFAIPGDEAFDEAKEEQLLADIPPPRQRGTGKPKSGNGKARQGGDAATGRVLSEAFVHDSDSEEGEGGADDGDSSRANYNETSPAPESGEQSQNERMRDADEASLDLADDTGHDARGSSIDLSVDPSNGGEQLENIDPELERDMASPKPRKKSKSKSKLQKREPPSSVKKHRKRYSGDMTLDPSPKKRYSGEMLDAGPQKTPAGSANKSRKRARADDVGTPNGSADPVRKNKKAKRVSNVPRVEQQAAVAEDIASSEDDMEDIPARLPRLV